MTRSIFDPAGDPERSGSRYTGGNAEDISHLPPRAVVDVDADVPDDAKNQATAPNPGQGRLDDGPEGALPANAPICTQPNPTREPKTAGER